VVCKKLSRKESVCFFITFDTTGKLLGEFPISLPEDTQLTHGQILGQGQDTFLLLGCYGPITGGNTKETEKKQLTTGFIAVPILYGKPQNSKVLNFLELSSSNQFLAEKDILALKKKALKKNKPITEYSVDFHVLMHDVRVIDKTCLIVLEVFNPQYHSETFTDFDFYGRPYTNSYSVFDGYRFSNAIVAGFGPGGELLWDNSISFRNILSMDLTPKLVLHPAANSEYVLLYLTEGMIASKIIQQSSTVEKTSFSPLDLRFPDDKLLSESRAAVQHWYRDYFLSYGYQEIKNLSGKMTGKRMVYSVTKLKFVR
jgi:hypothetical protein